MKLYRFTEDEPIRPYTQWTPSVDGGWMVAVEAVVVPWCAGHDEQMDPIDRKCFYAFAMRHKGETPCRLEEPARHYRIEE